MRRSDGTPRILGLPEHVPERDRARRDARLGRVTKRVRGTARSHRRPGTRPPSERSAGRRRSADETRPSQIEATAEVVEEIVEEHPVVAAEETQRVARTTHPRHRVKAGSLLAARAETEYVYVAQDMRRIAVVSGLLVATLITTWLLIVVLRVIPLPFY